MLTVVLMGAGFAGALLLMMLWLRSGDRTALLSGLLFKTCWSVFGVFQALSATDIKRIVFFAVAAALMAGLALFDAFKFFKARRDATVVKAGGAD